MENNNFNNEEVNNVINEEKSVDNNILNNDSSENNNKLKKILICIIVIIVLFLVGLTIYVCVNKRYIDANSNEKNNQYQNLNNDSKINVIATEYIEQLLLEETILNNGLEQTIAEYEGTTYDTGIRYIGKDPNNKIYYNCDTKDDNDILYGNENYNYKKSCEIWRIIGVFDVENENGNKVKRIKIINTNSLFQASWNSSTGSENLINNEWYCTGINCGRGINQWGESVYEDGTVYDGSELMQLLNGYYIGNSDSICRYCDGLNNELCNKICDANGDELKEKNMKPLTGIAKSMIGNAVWDTYALGNYNSAKDAYLIENGISRQYTGKSWCEEPNLSCTADGECVELSGGDFCDDSVKRTTSWTGLVGLMSVSDIAFANGWLYSFHTEISPWSISSYYNNIYASAVWYSISNSTDVKSVGELGTVWPSVYLNDSVRIISGNGQDKPYKLA